MTEPAIEHMMTTAPHTIGREQSLAAARRTMHAHGIRHLPVLHGGELVGIVSQRDIDMIAALRDVNPSEVTVGEAMSTEVYAVAPDALVSDVAQTMAEHKYGCAVVMDHGQVTGVFSTIDVLRAMVNLLRAERAESEWE